MNCSVDARKVYADNFICNEIERTPAWSFKHTKMFAEPEIITNTIWFLRLPFAAVFIFHGAGKLVMPVMSADMLGLPVVLVLLVGFAEVLAGVGAIVGGLKNVAKRHLVTRLSGLAATPVLLGAIAMAHWPQWSFMATETHPMGGMEFQMVLFGIALFFLVGAKKEA